MNINYKNNKETEELTSYVFKNVNNKQVQKVYTKLNGQIIEIRKWGDIYGM